ncbi:MAG: DNA internalization-related competence protein ComEC/Rec2 [Peptococcaceae bacterium]|nr:MAG: DNA internalization-related competence protein ComEC/Rec2 [Peptococcaceae bacterium]
MSRPLVILTLLYAAGVWLGSLVTVKFTLLMAISVAALIYALASCFLAWRGNRQAVFMLFLLLGLVMAGLAGEDDPGSLAEYAGRYVTLTGQVSSEPDVRLDKVFYLLETGEIVVGRERRQVTGSVRVQAQEPGRIYSYGDVLQAKGLLVRPEEPGNPGQFDYGKYLERQGIKVILHVREDNDLRKVGTGWRNPVLSAALRIKQNLVQNAGLSLSPSQAAVLNGVVFGIQGMIGREVRETFVVSGLVHILSVSGLHVGLILGGVLVLARLTGMAPGLTAPVASLVIVFYALMTGFQPAVMRATLMALLFLWAHYFGRDRDWPTTLAFAALVILLWKPFYLYHPGFQLSFAATWGILYLGPILADAGTAFCDRFSFPWSRAAAVITAIPLAAQLAAIPLVAWYYNLVSPVSVLANVVAAPLVGLLLFFGIVVAVLGLFWASLAGFVNIATGAVLDLFLLLAGFFQRLPGAVVYTPAPSVPEVAMWYAGLVFAGRFMADQEWRRKVSGYFAARRRVAGFAILIILVLAWGFWAPGSGSELAVHFIDVGQGDCSLVRTPGGKTMLIDTGGWREEFETGSGAGEQVVVPYLRRIGVRKIDVLVLSHPHEDHAAGAAAVVKSFPVALAVVSPAGGTGTAVDDFSSNEIPPAYVSLLREMVGRGITIEAAEAGDNLIFDPAVSVAVLSPGAREVRDKDSSFNNDSIVLSLKYGQKAFLFAGDIEEETQTCLVRQGGELAADVLKVPHHGSRHLLPAFVKEVAPDVAVISVGSRNNFGQPDSGVVALLQEEGAEVYRTDKDGAVTITTDGQKLAVRTGRDS